MRITYEEDTLRRFIHEAIRLILIIHSGGQILKMPLELMWMPVADSEQCIIDGIMEHIEEAGIHSGDSACSFRPILCRTIYGKPSCTTRVCWHGKLNVIGLRTYSLR